jgi:hypothetical protein
VLVAVKRTNDCRLQWIAVRSIDPKVFGEARLQAHYAVQWLARTARAYISEQPNDGHTSLRWDRSLGAFVTHSLPDGSWFSLKLGDLAFTIHGGSANKLASSLALDSVTETLVREWFGKKLGDRGFDAQRLDAPLPYKIPAHAIGNGEPYDPVGLASALAELATWFNNAAFCLGSLSPKMIKHKLVISPLRCWPHHFDIASLSALSDESADVFRNIGVGLSPGDEYYDEPYFYVSVYPKPDLRALSMLPSIGHWHERDFVAAIAPAHRIAAARDQHADICEFLHAAIDTAVKVLK